MNMVFFDVMVSNADYPPPLGAADDRFQWAHSTATHPKTLYMAGFSRPW
jgi:hypothetical protein